MAELCTILLNDHKELPLILGQLHNYLIEKGGVSLDNGKARRSGKNWVESYFYKNSAIQMSLYIIPFNKSYISIASEDSKPVLQELLRLLTPQTIVNKVIPGASE